ncbi:hypothetical protein [uncultured Roseobacter sp.]|uniref:hypothetical protein n=1 Tax=uncultured Roseobacter sp. TaxID=114847 RepID=UPI00260D26E1|nr:hypothetical protein [uncultured Roseobacter sp.]
MGFFDAEDIAAVAVEALSRSQFASGDLILTGPAALGYDDVAKTLGEVLGRPVRHHHLKETELAARHMAAGLPKACATTLAAMDTSIAAGSEDRVTDAVRRVTEGSPRSLSDFATASRAVWRKRVTA